MIHSAPAPGLTVGELKNIINAAYGKWPNKPPVSRRVKTDEICHSFDGYMFHFEKLVFGMLLSVHFMEPDTLEHIDLMEAMRDNHAMYRTRGPVT